MKILSSNHLVQKDSSNESMIDSVLPPIEKYDIGRVFKDLSNCREYIVEFINNKKVWMPVYQDCSVILKITSSSNEEINIFCDKKKVRTKVVNNTYKQHSFKPKDKQ